MTAAAELQHKCLRERSLMFSGTVAAQLPSPCLGYQKILKLNPWTLKGTHVFWDRWSAASRSLASASWRSTEGHSRTQSLPWSVPARSVSCTPRGGRASSRSLQHKLGSWDSYARLLIVHSVEDFSALEPACPVLRSTHSIWSEASRLGTLALGARTAGPGRHSMCTAS